MGKRGRNFWFSKDQIRYCWGSPLLLFHKFKRPWIVKVPYEKKRKPRWQLAVLLFSKGCTSQCLHWKEQLLYSGLFLTILSNCLFGEGVGCGMEPTHRAASGFWNGAQIQSGSEVFVCITFSFLLSHVVPFEKCDMVRNVRGQEHQMMNSLYAMLCIMQYPGAAGGLMALCNCPSQFLSLVIHFLFLPVCFVI